MKSFGQLNSEQIQRESDILSSLVEENKLEKLANFEAELSGRRSEILFKVATDIEDSENALKQIEQLAQRLRKHLEQLKGLQRVLSK
ncbi:MAG: hypothetical protein KAW83_00065 [Dehalococcoidia bacterium]|nr:hypothetical protein [Dehalococcoidia bacterium]